MSAEQTSLKQIVLELVQPLFKSEFFKILSNYKKYFLSLAAIIVLLGVGVFCLWPRSYVSSSSLMLISEGGRGFSGSGDAVKMTMLLSLAGGAGASPNQQKLLNVLNSRNLAEQVVEELQLQKDIVGQDRELTPQLKYDLAQLLSDKLMETNTRKPGLIEIRVRFKNREKVKLIVDTYISKLRAYLKGSILTMSQKAQAFLEEESQKSLIELNEAQDQLTLFQAQHKIISAQAVLQSLQSDYDEVLTSLNSSRINQNYLDKYLAPENPYLKSERNRINSLRSRLKELEGGTFSNKGRDKSSATSVALEYLRLERAMILKQMIYEALVKELQMARIDSSREDLSFEVLDSAVVPKSFAIPNWKIFLAAGLLLLILLELALFWLIYGRNFDQIQLSKPKPLSQQEQPMPTHMMQ